MSNNNTTNNTSERGGESIKQALAHVLVPPILLEGVSVLRVKVNGSMRESFLTLSKDRFTVYITSSKVATETPTAKKSSWLFGRNTKPESPSVTAADVDERSIDIGAIDRIQRGQVTHKFELAK